MRNSIYNKEEYRTSLLGLSPEELIQTHSAIKVSMGKTPKEKRNTKRNCETLQQVEVSDTVVQLLETYRARKELLSMLNVTQGVLMGLAHKLTGHTHWSRLHKIN